MRQASGASPSGGLGGKDVAWPDSVGWHRKRGPPGLSPPGEEVYYGLLDRQRRCAMPGKHRLVHASQIRATVPVLAAAGAALTLAPAAAAAVEGPAACGQRGWGMRRRAFAHAACVRVRCLPHSSSSTTHHYPPPPTVSASIDWPPCRVESGRAEGEALLRPSELWRTST